MGEKDEKVNWRDWFCHTSQFAYGIAADREDLTVDEYEMCAMDGTESIAGHLFAEKLTDHDIEVFKSWFEAIANR